MSDLAYSCEYLTSEKLCLAVSESEKAQATRQLRCINDEKMTCCYLCMFVLDCATPCQFLGSSENVPLKIDREKAPIESTATDKQKTEEEFKTEKAPVTNCSLCDVEMFQTRTKFTIDGWKGSSQELEENGARQLGQELPVIVYLCPKCGKIDLRAEEKLKKN